MDNKFRLNEKLRTRTNTHQAMCGDDAHNEDRKEIERKYTLKKQHKY